MSEFSNAVFGGLTWGLHDASNILAGGLTSYAVQRSGIDPFNTLFVNLDSPSGFSSWVHPAYASPLNVALNASGFDTTYAPLSSAIGNSFLGTSLFGGGFLGGGLFGGGLWGGGLFGGGLFGGGLWGGGLFGGVSLSVPSSSTYITSHTYTPLGVKPGFHGYF